MICVCACVCVCVLCLALEAQRRGLEELAEEKVEHVKKEGEAKYQSELVKKVCILSSSTIKGNQG